MPLARGRSAGSALAASVRPAQLVAPAVAERWIEPVAVKGSRRRGQRDRADRRATGDAARDVSGSMPRRPPRGSPRPASIDAGEADGGRESGLGRNGAVVRRNAAGGAEPRNRAVTDRQEVSAAPSTRRTTAIMVSGVTGFSMNSTHPASAARLLVRRHHRRAQRHHRDISRARVLPERTHDVGAVTVGK